MYVGRMSAETKRKRVHTEAGDGSRSRDNARYLRLGDRYGPILSPQKRDCWGLAKLGTSLSHTVSPCLKKNKTRGLKGEHNS